MRRLLPRLALAATLAAFPLAGGTAAQEGRDSASQIAGYERYLERKPYHDWAFDKLVEAAVAAGQLEELVTSWRSRLDESPGNEAARVVLARLLAATDEWEAALATLQELPEPGANTHRLVGQLEGRRGNTEASAAAFARAVAATDDPALLELLHGEHAVALLSAGDRDGAVAAFRALTELRPESFHLHVEAAAQLADNGLLDEAAAVLDDAKALAADDPEKRSRVLSELAEVHERRGDTSVATEAYFEAFGLLGRGHWLRRELVPRLVGLARRTGGMDPLIERCAAGAEERGDLAAREMHAEVLAAAGRRDEARAVLAAATADFPKDLNLSRALLALLAEDEDHAGRVLEFQRILVEHPTELELYLELGEAFAASGQLEAARREWERSLQQRVDDPNLCARLAGLFALEDQVDDAVLMYERAIGLEPAELRRYGDLAGLLSARERLDEAGVVLERAAEVAAGDARRLAELAGLWTEQGRPERARAALEDALVLEPGSAPLMSRLAELCRQGGDSERASELLRRVLDAADDASLRKAAVDRLVESADRDGTLERVVAAARAEIDAGADTLGPYLLAAKGSERLRKPAQAEAVLEALLVKRPDVEEAHLWLARLLEQDGALEEALARYRVLADVRPQARRRVLKDMARVYLELYRNDEAFECYEEILRAAPDNPAAWLEVASAYERLFLPEEALRCVRQAVRLDPGDGSTRLRLASILKERGEWERAEDEILAVTTLEDADSVGAARTRHYEMLREVGEVQARMEELRVRVQDNPYDVASSLTLSDLYARELEFELALETVDRLLGYQPREPRLLGERARLLERLERWDEALVAREELRRMPDANAEEVAIDLARVALELGDPERAREVLAGVRDPRRVAALFQRFELEEDALRTLGEGLTGGVGDEGLLFTIARIHEAQREWDAASEALEKVRALRGDSWRLTRQLGALRHQAGDREGTLAAGRRLFELFRVPDEELGGESAASSSGNYGQRNYNELQSWFRSQGLEEEYAEEILAEARRAPRDATLVQAAFSALTRDAKRAPELLNLVDLVRAATANDPPAKFTRRSWDGALWRYETSVYRLDRGLAEEAAKALAASLEGAPVDAPDDAWVRHAEVLRSLGDDEGALASLERGCTARPDSPLLRSAAATLAAELERWSVAEPHLTRLVELVAGVTSTLGDEERARQDALEAQSLRRMLGSFPRHLRRTVDDDALRAMRAYSRVRPWSLGSGPFARPTEPAAQLALARCLGELGRVDEARAILEALAADPDCSPSDRSTLAEVWIDLDHPAEAEALLRAFFDTYERLEADPVLRHGHGLGGRAGTVAKQLAELREKAGDTLEAYELLRDWGDARSAALLLETAGAHDAALVRFQAAADAAEDPVARRNALVRLAEVQQSARRWDEALATYTAIVAERPGDVPVLRNIALLHERAGRWEESVATHQVVARAKLAHNRRLARGEHTEERLLDPAEPAMPDREEDYSWQRLRRSAYYYRAPSRFAGQQAYELQTTYASILKLLLDHREVGRATEVLRDLAREDPQNFQSLSYSLGNIVERYAFEADALPMLRLLVKHKSSDESLRWQYADALVKAEKLDEARLVLRKLMSDPSVQEYYKDRARERLATVERRLGVDETTTLEDLRVAVEADPRNAQKRVDLVARLEVEHAWEEALLHARAAAAAAPHREDIQSDLDQLLARLGHLDELEARMRAALPGAKDERRLQLGTQLAEWAYARGDRDGVKQILAETFDKDVRRQYSAAAWWLAHQERDEAIAVLRDDLEHAESYRHEEIRAGLAALEGSSGDLTETLAAIREELAAMGTAEALVGGLARFAVALESAPQLAREAPDLVAAAEARAGLMGPIEAAAVEVALGDLAAAEQRLVAAAATDDRDGHLLVPGLVRLARARGDLSAAAEYLELLIDSGRLGRTGAVYVGELGRLSERDLAFAELGLLRAAAGDPAAAAATFERMEDLDDEQRPSVHALLFHEAGLHADALERIEAYLADDRERDLAGLGVKAELLEELARWTELIDVHEMLAVLEQNEDMRRGIRDRIVDAHRRAGTLPERLAEVQAAWETDPDDLDLGRELAQLFGELGQRAEQRAVLERLAQNPALGERVLPVLLTDAKRERDLERTVDIYRRMLDGNMDEWQRNRTRDELMALLARHGRVDEALDVIAQRHPDPETLEARLARADALYRLDMPEESLVEARAALALDPRNGIARRHERNALSSLERWGELTARTLEDLHDPLLRAEVSLGSLPRQALEEDGRGEALLAAANDSEDPVDWLVAGLVHSSRGETAEAVPWLERARKALPDELPVHEALIAAYQREERYADERGAIETLLPLLDRKRGAGETNPRYRIQQLRQRRGELHLIAGDADTALAAWQDGLGMHFHTCDSYTLYHGNYMGVFDRWDGRNPVGALEDCELWEQALALRSSASTGGRNEREVDGQHYLLRIRTGDVDRALDELWRMTAVRPSTMLVDSNYLTFYEDLERYKTSNEAGPTLLRLARVSGRLADWVPRVLEYTAARPEDSDMRRLQRLALEYGERWRELAAAYEMEFAEEEDGTSVQLLYLLGQAHEKAGEHGLALERFEEAARRVAGQAAAKDVQFFSSMAYQRQRRQPTRFQFASQGRSSGGGATHYGGSTDFEFGLRSARAGLLLLLDRRDEAFALEREHLGELEAALWIGRGFRPSLTDRYVELELWDDAVRVAEAELEARLRQEEGDEDAIARLRANHDRWLAATWTRAGAPERAGEAIERLLADFQRLMDEAENDLARAGVQLRRASFVATTLNDWERAHAERAEAVALRGEPLPATTFGAELRRRLGDPQGALEEFREAMRSRPWLRFGLQVGDRYTLALSEAAVGVPDAALLRSCLLDGPDDERADEARSALEASSPR